MKPYDPQTLSDFMLATQKDEILLHALETGSIKFGPGEKNGIIFEGSTGLGKTTATDMLVQAIEKVYGTTEQRAFARVVKVKSNMNGVQVLNSLDEEMRRWPTNVSGLHFAILDEVDRLTATAMEDLKSVMDIPGTVFVMTTNYISKLSKPVLSRSHVISFGAQSPNAWLPLARKIIDAEGGESTLLNDQFLLNALSKCKDDVRNIKAEMQRLALKMQKMPSFQALVTQRNAQAILTAQQTSQREGLAAP